MARATLVLVTLFSMILPATLTTVGADPSVGRTETESYTSSGIIEEVYVDPDSPDAGIAPHVADCETNVDGACFEIQPGDVRFRVTVADDSGHLVGFHSGGLLWCGQSGWLSANPDTMEKVSVLGIPDGTIGCVTLAEASLGYATTGTISVDFSPT